MSGHRFAQASGLAETLVSQHNPLEKRSKVPKVAPMTPNSHRGPPGHLLLTSTLVKTAEALIHQRNMHVSSTYAKVEVATEHVGSWTAFHLLAATVCTVPSSISIRRDAHDQFHQAVDVWGCVERKSCLVMVRPPMSAM
jgi:hypothetical protein